MSQQPIDTNQPSSSNQAHMSSPEQSPPLTSSQSISSNASWITIKIEDDPTLDSIPPPHRRPRTLASALRRKVTPKRKRESQCEEPDSNTHEASSTPPSQALMPSTSTSPSLQDLSACKKRFKRRNRHPFYQVSAILKQKTTILGKRFYLVRWAGYGPEEDSWVPPEDLNCPEKLEQFIKRRQMSDADLQ